MTRARYLVRFLHVVAPVPPMIRWTFTVAVCVAAALILLYPERAADALAPVLVLQLFAASSGFAGPARRGYYDLLLTSGDGRWRIAVIHWMLSIAPGVISWLVLALAEMLVRRGATPALLASGTCAAMFLLSTMPWAITTVLPRFAGGVGWLLVLVTVATVLSGGDRSGWIDTVADEPSIRSALAFLVYPAAVVGHRLTVQDAWTVLPAMTAATCAMAIAWRWISRADFPLEAAQ